MSGGKAARRRRQKRSPNPAHFKNPVCRNCGEPGPHFVPPSFGDIGFYACQALMHEAQRILNAVKPREYGPMMASARNYSTEEN